MGWNKIYCGMQLEYIYDAWNNFGNTKKIYTWVKSPLTKAKEKQRAQTFGQQTKTA